MSWHSLHCGDEPIPTLRCPIRGIRTNPTMLLALCALAIGSVRTVGAVERPIDDGAFSLLLPYEPEMFTLYERLVVGDIIVFHRQRRIGEAVVEKDQIVYQFDKVSGALLDRIEHWRSDLPDSLPPLSVDKVVAEALFPGEALFSELYYISPESDVFPIEPTPTNPCWAVTGEIEGRRAVRIIDAVSGEELGEGIVPPALSYALGGPIYTDPCEYSWASWVENARRWFNWMACRCTAEVWPSDASVESRIQQDRNALFFEIAHGGSSCFQSSCDGGICAFEVGSWIGDHRKMPFTFLASCDGLCSTGPGTLSWEFRKGSNTDCAAVGYCGMSSGDCSPCWTWSLYWQNKLFEMMVRGHTVKSAFDKANATYPACAGRNNCMRFVADEAFRVAPSWDCADRPFILQVTARTAVPGSLAVIDGCGFGTDAKAVVIRIGPKTVKSFVKLTRTSVVWVLPPMQPGTVPVSVVVNGQQSNSLHFTVR